MSIKMSLILLLFAIYLSHVSSENFFLPIPDHLGFDEGNKSYRVSLNPDIGSPSPPSKSTKISRNGILISDALPGVGYEVSIHYTNSTLKNIEVWRGVVFIPPMPPTNLIVHKIKNDKSVIINWSPPKNGLFSKYLFSLYNLSDQAKTPLFDSVALTKDFTFFALHSLIPGGSYEAQVRTASKHKEHVFNSWTSASANFTMKPNQPAKFIVFFKNETTLIITWPASPHTALFTGYKAFIIPPSASESSIFLEKQLDSADAPKATFTNLVPGRSYDIHLQTVSGNEYSTEVVDQYRTTPLPPSYLTYDFESITARSVRIKWKPPQGMCEFDAYIIQTNNSLSTPVVKFRNESTAYQLSDDTFLPGHVYQVMVKTLSAKVDSGPVSVNVRFRPLPVINLQSIMNVSAFECNTTLNNSISEWNKELNLYTVRWQVRNESFQDHFKIAYFEVAFQNGSSNTTMVDTNVRHLNVLLLPGRNYSIVVQAISHGVESDLTRISQVTKPLKPFIDKIMFNETGLLITWQSHADSRQVYYEVNVTSDDEDPLVKSETRIMTEKRLSLSNLRPGATYNIRIVSVSYELKSAPEEYKHVVYPKPPDNVTVERNSNNSFTVRWQIPTNTVFSAFTVSYRIGEDPTLYGPMILKANITRAEIKKMITGEQYQIAVSTVTKDDVKCLHPREIAYVLPPSPVTNIIQFEEEVDSTSVTLSFERPTGRIDYYEIRLVDSTADKIKITENVTDGSDPFSNFPRVSLPNLKPGTEYRLHLTCVSRGLRSAPCSAYTRLRPWIASKMIIVSDEYSTRSLALKYTPTPLNLTYFDEYKFQISDSNFTTKYSTVSDAHGEIIFRNLIPGRMYIIRMWTLAAGIPSAQPLEKRHRLRPEPINFIRAKIITDHSIELIWSEPYGEYDDFEVRYSAIEGNLSTITAQPYIIFNTLKPYRQYTLTVTVRAGATNESSITRHSKPYSATFMTNESVPGRIENFRPTRIQPSRIEFVWNLPNTSRNGILLRYFLAYDLVSSSTDRTRKTLDIMPAHARVTIDGLEPGKEYVFIIRAETKVGFGPSTEWIQKTPIWAPPQPASEMVPKEVKKGVKSIEIQFRKDFFSEQNGPITAYTIIVAEDTSEDISQRATLPPWSAEHSVAKGVPYQAVEPFYPSTDDAVVNFTIGEDECRARLAKTYCNGPLKNGSTYYVKVRAFTAPNKYVDTGYSLPIVTGVKQTVPLTDEGEKRLYAHSTYIGIVGCCLVIFSILFCEYTVRTSRKRATRIRMDRRTIRSAAATSDPVLQKYHPFQKHDREQKSSPFILHDKHAKLKMKGHEEESNHIDSTNSFLDLHLPRNSPSFDSWTESTCSSVSTFESRGGLNEHPT